jgi:SNF family Na+-dependent transporter
MSSIAVFLYVGHLAHILQIPLESLELSGAELCFIVFPMALNLLPWANLWAIIFFVMMLLLGIDTMFAFYGNFDGGMFRYMELLMDINYIKYIIIFKRVCFL